jgi:transposase-like protein
MTEIRKCPRCKQNTFTQQGSIYRCSDKECDFIGWGITDEIIAVGKGKGMTCPNCGNLVFHGVHEYKKDILIWRCKKCLYSGIGKPLNV